MISGSGDGWARNPERSGRDKYVSPRADIALASGRTLRRRGGAGTARRTKTRETPPLSSLSSIRSYTTNNPAADAAIAVRIQYVNVSVGPERSIHAG
jgi:hypothetical protein